MAPDPALLADGTIQTKPVRRLAKPPRPMACGVLALPGDGRGEIIASFLFLQTASPVVFCSTTFPSCLCSGPSRSRPGPKGLRWPFGNHRQPFRRLDPRTSNSCAVFAHSPISNLALERPQLTPRDQDRNTGTPIRALHMRNPFGALRLLKTGPPLSSAFGHRNRRVPKAAPCRDDGNWCHFRFVAPVSGTLQSPLGGLVSGFVALRTSDGTIKQYQSLA